MDNNILDDLRKMVLVTGQLSSVHVNTLRSAPLVFFDNLDHVKISYNIDTENPVSSVVEFQLVFNSDHIKDDIWEKRVDALKNTVKTILWKDIKINIIETVNS